MLCDKVSIRCTKIYVSEKSQKSACIQEQNSKTEAEKENEIQVNYSHGAWINFKIFLNKCDDVL